MESNRVKQYPLQLYKSCVTEYSLEWHVDYLRSAYMELAINERRERLPFAVVLSIVGGKVEPDVNSGSLHFDRVVRRSAVMMTVMLFDTNEQLDNFLDWYGSHKCSEISRVVG